jgi:hypothetical protein
MPGRTFPREFKLAVVRQLASGEKRRRTCAVSLDWQRACWPAGDASTPRAAAFTPQIVGRGIAATSAAEARIAEWERFLRPTCLRERRGKQRRADLTPRHARTNGAQHAVAERPAMIAAVQQAVAVVSLRRLCRWLGVGRSWYYARPT